MAQFIRGTGSNLTPLQHSLEIFKQYILTYFFATMTGKRGSGKPIVIDDKLFKGKSAGDVGRYHFVPQNFGDGIEGQNASITGNEESIDEFFMDLRIDQVAKAFAKKGKMTDLRTILNLRDEFKKQLENWYRWRTEKDVIDALTGIITDGVTKLTPAQQKTTPLVNGEGRCVRPDYNASVFSTQMVSAANSTDTALLTDMVAGDKMNTEILDNLQYIAKNSGKYPMTPIRLSGGEEYYMLVLHPKAAINLRADARWEKRALASMTGSGIDLSKDPIATGMMGTWERIIVKEAGNIKTATDGTKTIARNLLLGGDACVMAYAQVIDYNEEMRDYKRIMGVAADEIRGVKKLTFDGVDLNVAQVVSSI